MYTDFYKGLPVTVTGGAGFIGSELVRRLVALEANVTVIDDLSSGSLDALADVMPFIRFMCASIEDESACQAALDGAAVVFHMAAVVSVADSMIDPLKCNRVNISATAQLLEVARTYKIQKFVFSSSGSVYGDVNVACSEDMPCAPASSYAYSKWVGEILCQQYWKLYALPSVCLRYFNVYSLPVPPYVRNNTLVTRVWKALEQKQPIYLYGDGTATRDFVSVVDVVEANLKAGALPAGQSVAQSINVATGVSTTLNDMIAYVVSVFEQKEELQIKYMPARAGDVLHSRADCTRYRNQLG